MIDTGHPETVLAANAGLLQSCAEIVADLIENMRAARVPDCIIAAALVAAMRERLPADLLEGEA